MARFFQIVLLAGLALAVSSQDYGTNYNTGDSGRSESVGPDGEVRGQYQYTDPNGKLITVKYTAGKDGFMVEGDHLPKAPQGPAPQQQQPQQQYNQYNPQPQQYNQQPQQYNPQPQQNSFFNNFNQQQPGQSNFFQQQQPNFGQQQPQQYQPQPQQYNNHNNYNQQQASNLPIPQLPSLSGGSNNFGAAPQTNALGNGFNPFQNNQAQPQQYYNNNNGQYNGNNNNGNRPAKVSVSQQPGQGFQYNFES